MNKLHVSLATVLDAAPADEPSSASVALSGTVPLEFAGSSDDTIAEAVRRALSRAARSLRTLEGVEVVVIPQIARHDARPRFHVTLRVSPSAGAPLAHAPQL
jgi:flavin-binding protein dodecin